MKAEKSEEIGQVKAYGLEPSIVLEERRGSQVEGTYGVESWDVQVFKLILLEEETDLSTATKRGVDGVGGDGDSSTACSGSQINEVGGAETNTELTDHRDISPQAESLHEALENAQVAKRAKSDEKTNPCARFRDGTQVVDHVCLGHTDSGIANLEDLVLLVRSDVNTEVFLGIQLGWISYHRTKQPRSNHLLMIKSSAGFVGWGWNFKEESDKKVIRTTCQGGARIRMPDWGMKCEKNLEIKSCAVPFATCQTY
ncbi:hypothetical protein BDZ97DRAFT_2063093 [Flammula alnicola]|nr:hypothetical protein BDZ97DRAFT_2063093 [Flammula alnicola]